MNLSESSDYVNRFLTNHVNHSCNNRIRNDWDGVHNVKTAIFYITVNRCHDDVIIIRSLSLQTFHQTYKSHEDYMRNDSGIVFKAKNMWFFFCNPNQSTRKIVIMPSWCQGFVSTISIINQIMSCEDQMKKNYKISNQDVSNITISEKNRKIVDHCLKVFSFRHVQFFNILNNVYSLVSTHTTNRLRELLVYRWYIYVA